MDSPCIKQTVCKVLKKFQHGKYLVAYVLKSYLFDSTDPEEGKSDSPHRSYSWKRIKSGLFKKYMDDDDDDDLFVKCQSRWVKKKSKNVYIIMK